MRGWGRILSVIIGSLASLTMQGCGRGGHLYGPRVVPEPPQDESDQLERMVSGQTKDNDDEISVEEMKDISETPRDIYGPPEAFEPPAPVYGMPDMPDAPVEPDGAGEAEDGGSPAPMPDEKTSKGKKTGEDESEQIIKELKKADEMPKTKYGMPGRVPVKAIYGMPSNQVDR